MYTTCADMKLMTTGLYARWKERHADQPGLLAAVEQLIKNARPELRKEHLLFFGNEDNVLTAADQAAFYAAERHSLLGPSHQIFDQKSSLDYYELKSTNCINSVLLSLFFHGLPSGLLIQPSFVNEYDWRSVRELLGQTDLRHIGVLLYGIPFPELETRHFEGTLKAVMWDVALDQCFAILEQKGRSYTETEDGYPITIDTYTEKFEEIAEGPVFREIKQKWLDHPRLDPDAARIWFDEKKRTVKEMQSKKRS